VAVAQWLLRFLDFENSAKKTRSGNQPGNQFGDSAKSAVMIHPGPGTMSPRNTFQDRIYAQQLEKPRPHCRLQSIRSLAG
jgi:hypothetical protein